jgi:hypothetical protein
MNALTIGTRTGLDVYRSGTLSGYGTDANSYAARAARYDQYQMWYDNTMFETINAFMNVQRSQLKLYRHIRAIYNPVHRLVNLETAKTYGGSIDWAGGLRIGAIPVVGADDTLVEAIKTILKWSNFGTEKGPYVRQGSKFGESYLKIVDDVSRKRVRMEVLNPYKVRDVRFNEVGDIKWIAIQYYKTDEAGKDYVIREEIDQNEFRYWEDYNLNAFDMPNRRDPDIVDANPYGFVPVRQIPHTKESDSRHGRPSFNGVLGKIVQLNDIAAPLHDAVRLSVNPIYGVKGAIIHDEEDPGRPRDSVKTLSVPKDGDIFPLAPTLDIASGLAAMDKLIGEIERDMPQLSLQRIRESGGDASGVSIENSYSDASDLLIETQGTYDEGLTRALQMAISIAAYRGYEQFRAYDPITSYERGDLDFYIQERAVFSDRIPEAEKQRLIMEAADSKASRVVLRNLGVSEEDIDEIEAGKQEQAAQQAAAAIRGLAQGFGMDEDETDEEGDASNDDQLEPAADA